MGITIMILACYAIFNIRSNRALLIAKRHRSDKRKVGGIKMPFFETLREETADISPQDAKQKGIAKGDYVKVWSRWREA